MSSYQISPSKLHGSLALPTSKSHSLRAILFATLAHGTTEISGLLPSPDTTAMLTACQELGAIITKRGELTLITGTGGHLKAPRDIIDCGNSGLVLRFIGAISALLDAHVVLTGDHSIKTRRPMAPLLSGLRQLGATCISLKGDELAPVIIKGPIQAGELTIDGQDSQPVSALMIAATQLAGTTILKIENLGERPWLEMTSDWLQRLGAKVEIMDHDKPSPLAPLSRGEGNNPPSILPSILRESACSFKIEGGARFTAFNYQVPGDLSSLAFPLVAALITNSELTIDNVDLSDCQGDGIIVDLVRSMGAVLDYDCSSHQLQIRKAPALQGIEIDMNQCIDALPALAVLGCFAVSPTTLYNAEIARAKESDRLQAMSDSLQLMGAKLTASRDSLTIYPSVLHGATLDSYQDHRIAMALSVAALGAVGNSVINDTRCVNKTFPGFVESMHQVGGEIACLAVTM